MTSTSCDTFFDWHTGKHPDLPVESEGGIHYHPLPPQIFHMTASAIASISDPLVRNRFIRDEIDRLYTSISRCTVASSIASRRSQIKALMALR